MTGCTYIPRTKSSKWNPSGVIKAYDTKVNKYVPIKGVRVRGTHLLTIKETLTDGTGYYCLDAFTSPVNMKVVWEGESWDVRDGNLGQAVYEGSKVENLQWNLLINSTETKQLAFSALHRAAYRYYCDFIFNISRPDNSRREKLAYIDDEIKDGESNGDFNQQLGLGIWSDIRIPGMNADDRISNISPSVVEEIVFNSRSFTEIRDKLADYISKYRGPMYNLNQNNINLLFKNYL